MIEITTAKTNSSSDSALENFTFFIECEIGFKSSEKVQLKLKLDTCIRVMFRFYLVPNENGSILLSIFG